MFILLYMLIGFDWEGDGLLLIEVRGSNCGLSGEDKVLLNQGQTRGVVDPLS